MDRFADTNLKLRNMIKLLLFVIFVNVVKLVILSSHISNLFLTYFRFNTTDSIFINVYLCAVKCVKNDIVYKKLFEEDFFLYIALQNFIFNSKYYFLNALNF